MKDSKRLYYLDFIRVVSMFIIIIFHFNCTIHPHGVYKGNRDFIFYDCVNGYGAHVGVALFFILSGASLMYTYKNNFDIRMYFKRRWLGIFPMFYLAWVMGMLYYFWRFGTLNPFCVQRSDWTIIFTILGLDGYLSSVVPNFYILGEWFLGCIILLYILFPILLLAVKKIGVSRLLIISLLCYIPYVQIYNIESIWIDMFFVTRILDIVIGMYIIEKVDKIKMWHVLFGLGYILLWLFVKMPMDTMYKITLIGTASFVVLCYIGRKITNEKIINVIVCLSKYSYAIFLVHHIVIDQVCNRFEERNYTLKNTMVVFIICCIIIFAVAVALKKATDAILNFFSNNNKACE